MRTTTLSFLTILFTGMAPGFASGTTHTNTTHTNESAVPVDNSGVNERDRHSNEVTADQQGNNKSDLEATRKIRQNIMAQKDLSLYAHNVKIIASNGLVTLKGPVETRSELDAINKIACDVVGSKHVKNELQIRKSE